MSEVEWREVVGHPKYKVSNKGEIMGVYGKLMKPQRKNGYLTVHIGNQYKGIHRIVLEAFVGACPQDQEGRHLDDDKENNELSNLAYGTRLQNAQDRIVNGKTPKGIKNPNARLTEATVSQIRNLTISKSKSLDELACCYGVSKSTIRKVIHGETWRHVEYGLRFLDQRSPKCKLNEATVTEIRKRMCRANQYDLAEEYGVSQPTISKIARRKIWRHVQ